MSEGKYLSAKYVSYKGILKHFKISDNFLQPLFEAFTNSMEAIKIAQQRLGIESRGKITVRYYVSPNLKIHDNPFDFVKMEIEDNGIGFDDIEFSRLQALNDESKGKNNKGSGRVQFLHFFNYTSIESIYFNNNSSTNYSIRKFTLSKSDVFLEKEAIIRLDEENETNSKNTNTKVTFTNLIVDKPNCIDFYNKLTIIELKDELISHYLPLFCETRNHLPTISLEYYVNDVLDSKEQIKSNDIPKYEKKRDIKVHYSKFSPDGKQIIKDEKRETFKLKSYRISKDKLSANSLKLVSKGEIAMNISIQSLAENEHIDDHRYLFLMSGDYLTSKDSDNRGELLIPSKDEFKKHFSDLYAEKEVILLDEIKDKANRTIESLYTEIAKQKEEKERNIEELRNMFLLDSEHLNNLRIGINDTDDQILNKVYEADAKVSAKRDAFLKHQVEEIDKLNPTEKDYQDKLIYQVDELVKTIPLQNRTALTKYVARRKLVLDLFDKILKKQLEIQSTSKRNIDEKLLHTLLFQQSSSNPESSDLWLINEDFIYYSGTSEAQLGDISIAGERIMKEELTEAEIQYRDSLEEKRYEKRPDVLLFPDEGKCIIIEFKNPLVNASDHISQINNYASLIRNLSKDEFQFETFYGYLIGEKINSFDVQNKDPYFQDAHSLDYLFRPHYPVRGQFGRSDGSLYTEIIKYTVLLERARQRNEIFIRKLDERIVDEPPF